MKITLALTREEAVSLTMALERVDGLRQRSALLCARVNERLVQALGGDIEFLRAEYLNAYAPRKVKHDLDCPVHNRPLRRDRASIGLLLETFYCPTVGCTYVKQVSP